MEATSTEATAEQPTPAPPVLQPKPKLANTLPKSPPPLSVHPKDPPDLAATSNSSTTAAAQ